MNWLKSLFSKDMLPLDEEDAPKGVITAKGTMSYEDFAKKELTEYHQHGTVSDLMAVIGLGVKPQEIGQVVRQKPLHLNKHGIRQQV